ncbi:hypothetical protein Q9189_004061 [Teloschistes chrysophthalmus]
MSHPIPPPPLPLRTSPPALQAPPLRSTTAPATDSHKPHNHHHHHHIHRHHRDKSHSHQVPQSAVLPTTSSSSSNPFKNNDYPLARDLFSPLTKAASRLDSSRHDLLGGEGRDGKDGREDGGEVGGAAALRSRQEQEAVRKAAAAAEGEKREREMWKEVEGLRRRRERVGKEYLTSPLTSLTTLSTTTTRRLDYTHYALLSSLSSLSTTLTSLASLSASTSDLLTSFSAATAPAPIPPTSSNPSYNPNPTTTTNKSISINPTATETANQSLTTFSLTLLPAQQKRLDHFAARATDTQRKTEELVERLEVVRGKVGREEGRERVERGRRRWWGRCVGCVFLGVVGLLVTWRGLRGLGAGGGDGVVRGVDEVVGRGGKSEWKETIVKGEREMEENRGQESFRAWEGSWREWEEVLVPERKWENDGWEGRLRGLEEL